MMVDMMMMMMGNDSGKFCWQQLLGKNPLQAL
jgi:hypothetical protein